MMMDILCRDTNKMEVMGRTIQYCVMGDGA